MSEIPYNKAELVAMKEDLADRKFKTQLVGYGITAALAVAGVAAFVFVPGASAMLTALGSEGTKAVLGAGALAAGTATSLITMKELKRIELDEKYLETYMAAKNHWGEGYREEVAEQGYNVSGPSFAGAVPPMPSKEKQR
jgi:hypothetical protein